MNKGFPNQIKPDFALDPGETIPFSIGYESSEIAYAIHLLEWFTWGYGHLKKMPVDKTQNVDSSNSTSSLSS